MAVSCCTAFSFLTSDMAFADHLWSLLIYTGGQAIGTLQTLNENILMVAASFVKLHLLASVLNQWMYAAGDSFSHCWISMNHEV